MASPERAADRPRRADDAAPSDPPARRHGLDALRGGALMLGIVLHALMPFLPGSWWPVTDVQSSGAATVTVATIHLFRMVLFMMLAGYFGRLILYRRGTRAYLRDRGLRVLLPVVVLGPLAVASVIGASALDRTVRGTPPPELPPGTPDSLWMLFLVAPAHLWFLQVLVQCILVTVVLRVIAVRLLGRDRLDRATRRVGRLLAVPVLGVAVAAVPYLVALLLQGAAGAGIDTPSTVLPEAAPLTAYLGAFLVGWFLHAHQGALPGIARGWWAHLAAAVTLTATTTLVGDDLPLVAHAALVALVGWTWTFGLVGAAMRLTRERPTVRYLADASYWMYLVHLPLLLTIGVFLGDLTWPVGVKLLIACGVCTVVLLISYDLLVRDTWLGAWLNGRRRPAVLRRGRGRGRGRGRPARQPAWVRSSDSTSSP